MTSTATATRTAVQVGESRGFEAGVHVVTVYRKTATCYRVTVAKAHETVGCYTVEFDHERGNLPHGMSGKRAAWEYMQTITAEMTAAAERPADLLARTAADYAASDLSRLSPAQRNALVTADGEGTVRRGNGITVKTLQALARAHVGLLVYRTEGMRRIVAAVQLNKHGRTLAAHVKTNQIAA